MYNVHKKRLFLLKMYHQMIKCPEIEVRLTVRMHCVGKFEVRGGG